MTSRKSVYYLANKKAYLKHRQNIKRAKSLISMQPSKTPVRLYINHDQLQADQNLLSRRSSDNCKLILAIQKIQCSEGHLRTFKRQKVHNYSKLSIYNADLENIERDNFRIGCRLLKVKSSMDTRHNLARTSDRDERDSRYAVPPRTLKRYSSMMLTQNDKLMRKLLRPKIFFDLYVEKLRPLGRIYVLLFTEACPELVLQLVHMCTYNALERLKFIRIFPALWIEAELTVKNNTLSSPGFMYNMNIIDHGIGSGVFSFAQRYLNGFPQGLLNFAISFKELHVLNGQRVPFAVVTHGLKVLESMQDYGTKNGKPIKNILVTKSGLIS